MFCDSPKKNVNQSNIRVFIVSLERGEMATTDEDFLSSETETVLRTLPTHPYSFPTSLIPRCLSLCVGMFKMLFVIFYTIYLYFFFSPSDFEDF